jgi:hypothetical protein
LKEKENSNVPNKGLGIKVGTVIGHIEAGHGIEIVALEIAERERTGQIWRHSHGIKALHGAVVEFKRRRSGEQGKERLRGGGGGREEHGMRCGCADGFGEKWSRGFCGERRRFLHLFSLDYPLALSLSSPSLIIS